MISNLVREHTLDLSAERLGAGWLRRKPTQTETREFVSDTVWRTGLEFRFRQALIDALDSASEVVLLCSFLLADEQLTSAMLRSAARGVRVYVITSSEQRIGRQTRDDDFLGLRMVDEHKKLLSSLAGKVLLRSAEHIHAKFLVVDPRSPTGARAWLSTANFNKALEDNIELGVALDAAGARMLATCFHWAFWHEAEREMRGTPPLLKTSQDHPAAPPRPVHDSVLVTLRDHTGLRERIVAMIGEAQREILVASYGLGADHVAVRALVDAAKRGVRVTLLTRPRSAVALAAAALAAAGVTVLAHDKLHAKALVVDGEALVMSANLEAQGLDQGFEVGAVLPASTARGVEETLREWAAGFPWVYRDDATRGEHLGDFCPVGASPRDGTVSVVELHRQDAPRVIANDALALDEAPPPALAPSAPSKKLPQRVIFGWSVVPPSLPKGAIERLQAVEREESGKDGSTKKMTVRVPHAPRLFDHGGKVYVLIESAEFERIRAVSAELSAVAVVR